MAGNFEQGHDGRVAVYAFGHVAAEHVSPGFGMDDFVRHALDAPAPGDEVARQVIGQVAQHPYLILRRMVAAVLNEFVTNE